MAKPGKKPNKKEIVKKKKAPKIEERIYIDMPFEEAVRLAARTSLKRKKLK